MDRPEARASLRVFLLSAGLSAGVGCAGGPPQARWEPLFDGRSLAGFHAVGNAEWKVEGREILGRQGTERPRGGWLVSDRTFRDFELELEFRTSRWANSGVVVRDPKGCTGVPYIDGYEIQILNRSGDRFPTGSIYGRASAPYGLHREGAWNRLQVIARGGSIRVFLNGRKACEIPEGAREEAGAIGFQVSPGYPYRDMWVRFRDIRIRDLGGGSGAADRPAAKPEGASATEALPAKPESAGSPPGASKPPPKRGPVPGKEPPSKDEVPVREPAPKEEPAPGEPPPPPPPASSPGEPPPPSAGT